MLLMDRRIENAVPVPKVTVVILTDGEENASSNEFTHDTFNPSDHDYVRQQYLNSSAPIFLLVSDNFLKSENCMKNILEMEIKKKLVLLLL